MKTRLAVLRDMYIKMRPSFTYFLTKIQNVFGNTLRW